MKTLFFREFTKYVNTWGFIESLSTSDYFEVKNNNIVFKFCGFLSLDNYLICVFPKGFPVENKSDSILQENAQLLIKVLKKYNRKSIQNNSTNTHNKKKYNNNYVSLSHELTNDYLRHGLINQNVKIQRLNGPGKTNWNKTIKKTLPITSNNALIYLDIINEKKLRSMSSELIQLHWLILKDIEEKIGWLINFKVAPIQISANKINIKRAKNTLKKAINTSYNQTVIRRLKLLLQYIEKNFYGDDISKNPFKILYTFNFLNVWESICKVIYDDLPELHEKVPVYKWQRTGIDLKDTSIIPDILTHHDIDKLIIIDAKYYPELNEQTGESKLPPSGDISKQFIYRKALSLTPEFTNKTLFNVFILPGVISDEYCHTKEIARVGFYENPDLIADLHEIVAFQIDAERAMRDYLNNSIEFKEHLVVKLS